VVPGSGTAWADVLLVGAAPGPGEDALGVPVVGQAGRLLERALAAAGLRREDVWTTTLVKCLPPDARDPTPGEVASCADHLVAQVEAVRPVVVVALGGFVTKVLRGRPEPIRERRGQEEPRLLGDVAHWLLPVYAPSAALYGPELAAQLHADLARLPSLVARGRPELAPAEEPGDEAAAPPAPAEVPGQLGLF
jgi:DNA polymerase